MGDDKKARSPTAIVVNIKPPGPPPSSDWYDGRPKRCPGSGLVPRPRFMGEVSEDGDRLYVVRCDWCDTPQKPGEPMPDHTFIPVDPDTIAFKTGKFLEGIESGPPPGLTRRKP